MKQITIRLKRGQDLKEGIVAIVKENNVKAGVIVSAVGCIDKATLRIADGKTVKTWDKKFEIVSITGTVSVNGCHIHVSLSDTDGMVVGGHLKEGCIINTTAEIVILNFEDTEYLRPPDATTGYDELEVN
ncbi:MAG: DNA-binding protein [Candidatus Doudnabacteria bacterium]|nr:DNA-binding protein [Candidatus Doudnabacteria bacterium]